VHGITTNFMRIYQIHSCIMMFYKLYFPIKKWKNTVLQINMLLTTILEMLETEKRTKAKTEINKIYNNKWKNENDKYEHFFYCFVKIRIIIFKALQNLWILDQWAIWRGREGHTNKLGRTCWVRRSLKDRSYILIFR
jgi:hypothetical protein